MLCDATPIPLPESLVDIQRFDNASLDKRDDFALATPENYMSTNSNWGSDFDGFMAEMAYGSQFQVSRVKVLAGYSTAEYHVFNPKARNVGLQAGNGDTKRIFNLAAYGLHGCTLVVIASKLGV